MNTINDRPVQTAPLLRRFGAIFYDGLLVIAVLLLATALVTPLLPEDPQSARHRTWVTLYLFGIVFLFFGWFWTHGGQTLGMRAWRLRLSMEDGTALGWNTALLRFMCSVPGWGVFLFGIIDSTTSMTWPGAFHWLQELTEGSLIYLGLAWLIMDNWPNNWRERFTHTRVEFLPKATHVNAGD